MFLFLPLCMEAQTAQKISLSGIVNAGRPIHAADCFLKNNQHLGTMTDSVGYFQFTFPPTLLYDTLVISALGFETSELPLSSIDLMQDTVHFYLEQQSILLNEVLIESKGPDLKGLVLKALARMSDNYPNKPHQLRGLYRKVSTEGAGYTHLEEAAVIIDDNSYGRPLSLAKIQTQFFRETNDWGHVDSLHVAAFNKMNRHISRQLNIFVNSLYKLYGSSFIRHYKDEDSWFDLNRMKKMIDDHYAFELIDISVSDGDTIYHIALAGSMTPPPPKRVSPRNYLKINIKDFAIVEMQRTLGFENQSIISQDQVKFEKQHGRYYPVYIRSMGPRSINRKEEDDEYDIYTFFFDDVRVGRFKKIKPAEAIDPYEEEGFWRNPASLHFWDSTALIKKFPLGEGIKRDLEKYQPLEQQFRQNGRH